MPTAPGEVGSIAYEIASMLHLANKLGPTENALVAKFIINEDVYAFKGKYEPKVAFLSRKATLTYKNVEDLSGDKIPLSGNIGPSNVKIEIPPPSEIPSIPSTPPITQTPTTTISGPLDKESTTTSSIGGGGGWTKHARYDIFQQTFMLSMIANIVKEEKGTQQRLQSVLQEAVPACLWEPRLGTGWRVVWGPVAWKKDPNDANTGPDHSWFVAKNDSVKFEDGTSHETYVIAIAGTAKSSRYDWIEVNFNVSRVVDFAAWVKAGIDSELVPMRPAQGQAGSYISFGTAKGTHTILNTKSPDGAASPGKSLHEFIKGLPDTPSKLLFTGHSMGAAISPTAALALAESGAIPGEISTHTYPTAGASPGNKTFAASFAEKFPKVGEDTGHKVWNCNIFNKRDIVPQEWCTDASLSPEQNLGNIEGIYGLPPPRRLLTLVNLLTANVNGAGVIYVPLPGRPFDGPRPAAPPGTIDEFLKVAQEEHVEAYAKFVGIEVPKKEKTAAGRITTATLAAGYMIALNGSDAEAAVEIEASGVVANEEA